MTRPHAIHVGGEDWSSGNVADPARTAWRDELAGLGGVSPLLHFVDAPTTRIELSTTHPGGVAQFITGKSTLLSQLIRDDIALRGARIAADRIAAKGLELSTTRGIDAIRLGIGVVRWRHAGEDFCAPAAAAPARHPPARPRLRAQAARVGVPQPRARRRAREPVRHLARRRRRSSR